MLKKTVLLAHQESGEILKFFCPKHGFQILFNIIFQTIYSNIIIWALYFIVVNVDVGTTQWLIVGISAFL